MMIERYEEVGRQMLELILMEHWLVECPARGFVVTNPTNLHGLVGDLLGVHCLVVGPLRVGSSHCQAILNILLPKKQLEFFGGRNDWYDDTTDFVVGWEFF